VLAAHAQAASQKSHDSASMTRRPMGCAMLESRESASTEKMQTRRVQREVKRLKPNWEGEPA